MYRLNSVGERIIGGMHCSRKQFPSVGLKPKTFEDIYLPPPGA